MAQSFNSLNGAINILNNIKEFTKLLLFQFLKWCD